MSLRGPHANSHAATKAVTHASTLVDAGNPPKAAPAPKAKKVAKAVAPKKVKKVTKKKSAKAKTKAKGGKKRR